MAQATVGKEFVVSVPDEVGAGASALRVLADEHINLACFVGYGVPGGKANLHFVPEDPARAEEALKRSGYDFQVQDAILYVEGDRPGLAADILQKIANAGVQVIHCYATAVGGANALFVILTEDNAKAIQALSG